MTERATGSPLAMKAEPVRPSDECLVLRLHISNMAAKHIRSSVAPFDALVAFGLADDLVHDLPGAAADRIQPRVAI